MYCKGQIRFSAAKISNSDWNTFIFWLNLRQNIIYEFQKSVYGVCSSRKTSEAAA